MSSRKSMPVTKPARNASTERIGLLPQNRRRPRLDHPGQFHGIPIRQPDAAMRLGMTYVAGLGCAVNAIVILGEGNPNHSHRIVRTGLYERLLVLPIRVPKQIRVVV